MKNQTTSIHLHTPSSPRIGEPPEVVPPELKILISLLTKANIQQIRAIYTYAKHVIGF